MLGWSVTGKASSVVPSHARQRPYREGPCRSGVSREARDQPIADQSVIPMLPISRLTPLLHRSCMRRESPCRAWLGTTRALLGKPLPSMARHYAGIAGKAPAEHGSALRRHCWESFCRAWLGITASPFCLWQRGFGDQSSKSVSAAGAASATGRGLRLAVLLSTST